jgi:hypothetical protein
MVHDDDGMVLLMMFMAGILGNNNTVLTELTMITERMLPELLAVGGNGKGVAGVVWNVKMQC